MEITKTCSKCGEVKAVEMFSMSRSKRRSICKACESIYSKIYYETNREIVAKRHRDYCQANLEKGAKQSRDYRKKNADRVARTSKAFRQRNRSKEVARAKKYRQENAGKIAAQSSQRYIANKPKNIQRDKSNARKHRQELSKNYVKRLIAAATGCEFKNIPPELIEVKRKHLQLLRKIKELTND